MTTNYTFTTPKRTYHIEVWESGPDDDFDHWQARLTHDGSDETADFTSDRDIRGAVGVLVMRVIRREQGLQP